MLWNFLFDYRTHKWMAYISVKMFFSTFLAQHYDVRLNSLSTMCVI